MSKVAASRLSTEGIELLVQQAAEGDASAAKRLLEALWPSWLKLVGASPAMRTLAAGEDHARNVGVVLAAKLGTPGARALKSYRSWRERHPEKSFDDYHRIVVANATRDYVRSQTSPGASGDSDLEPRRKRLVNEFAASPALEQMGQRPGVTPAQTALQLADFATTRLPKRQLTALVHWLQGADPAELDASLGAAPGEGSRVLRAAIATLRREFAG